MNKQTATMYPLKIPNNKPKLLSTEPTPVHTTVLPTVFPISMVEKRVNANIAIPKPILLINSDSI